MKLTSEKSTLLWHWNCIAVSFNHYRQVCFYALSFCMI